MEESPSEARKMFRPIRPNPLIPILTDIFALRSLRGWNHLVGKTKAWFHDGGGSKTELLRHKPQSIPTEFLRPDIVFLDPCICQHFSHCRNHGASSSDVIDLSLQALHLPQPHSAVETTDSP